MHDILPSEVKTMFYFEKIGQRILRFGAWMLPLVLIYICYYILTNAPDGGCMIAFRQTVAELLSNAIASLALLICGAAIPDLRFL